jgi:TolA-binding protein
LTKIFPGDKIFQKEQSYQTENRNEKGVRFWVSKPRNIISIKGVGMRNVAFIILVSFLLFLPFNLVHAVNDTEYEKALKYYNSGKYKEAVGLFSDYVKKRPDPSAYYYIGYALYKLHKYGEATEYFQQAFLIDPAFSLGDVNSATNPLRKNQQKLPNQ